MCEKREKNKKKKTKKLSQFLKSHISGTLEAISLKFGMWSAEGGGSVHRKNRLVSSRHLFHQGSTELRRCENCVFFLPVNILTGVTRRLLGPHDTLPCVLILAFILATTSFPAMIASINPSSPSAAHAYSFSSVAFASPFKSFIVPVQSLLHLSSIDMLSVNLFINVSASISSLSRSSPSSPVCKRMFASSIARCSQDFAGPINLQMGPDIMNVPCSLRHFVTKTSRKFTVTTVIIIVRTKEFYRHVHNFYRVHHVSLIILHHCNYN